MIRIDRELIINSQESPDANLNNAGQRIAQFVLHIVVLHMVPEWH